MLKAPNLTSDRIGVSEFKSLRVIGLKAQPRKADPNKGGTSLRTETGKKSTSVLMGPWNTRVFFEE